MSTNDLVYPLEDGYLHHWLVLGPVDLPIADRPRRDQSEHAFQAHLLDAVVAADLEFDVAPRELARHDFDGRPRYWEIVHCGEDHLIETDAFFPTYTHRRLWAYVRLATPSGGLADLVLWTTCPASLWLNGERVQCVDHLAAPAGPSLGSTRFPIALRPGENDLWVRLDQISVRDAVTAVAVRLDSVAASDVTLRVPTVTERPKRRIVLEHAFDRCRLDRAVYTHADRVRLLCAPEEITKESIVMRIEKPDGRIYAETHGTLEPGTVIDGVSIHHLPAGTLRARLMTAPEDYYGKFRAERMLPLWVSNRPYAFEPTGSADERVSEALREAVRSDDVVSSTLARMALGNWDAVKVPALRTVVERVRRGEADVLPDVVALIGMSARMGQHPRFPADLTDLVDDCLVAFDYSGRETWVDLDREDSQILLLAARVLAGQLRPDVTFVASGLRGDQERRRAERQAAAWLRRAGQNGFRQWDSHTEHLIVALSHLADLAVSRTVSELAAVLLDKLFFGLAVGSLRGSFGSSRGSADAQTLRSARLVPEAALSRLLWGVGCYSEQVKGVISLALARDRYQPPDLLQAIALDQRDEAWTRERHRGGDTRAPGVDVVDVHESTYRTPDFLLCSAQDYRPGEPGRREHVWQATLGPEAIVFTNHPAALAESRHRGAGWWRGNARLPRVAQWRDALIALYRLPDDDWLGFTHAYFPCEAFDEHHLEQGWAFARRGSAYLALWSSTGLELIERGVDAFRELRARGQWQVWLCQLGRSAVDGSFADFRARVLGRAVRTSGVRVDWETVRGDRLTFDWTGGLLVNGQEQPIAIDKHVDSPYATADLPAKVMHVGYGDEIVRLSFA